MLCNVHLTLLLTKVLLTIAVDLIPAVGREGSASVCRAAACVCEASVGLSSLPGAVLASIAGPVATKSTGCGAAAVESAAFCTSSTAVYSLVWCDGKKLPKGLFLVSDWPSDRAEPCPAPCRYSCQPKDHTGTYQTLIELAQLTDTTLSSELSKLQPPCWELLGHALSPALPLPHTL